MILQMIWAQTKNIEATHLNDISLYKTHPSTIHTIRIQVRNSLSIYVILPFNTVEVLIIIIFFLKKL